MLAREAAFQALYAALQEESFVSDFLARWQEKDKPTAQDFGLAFEIASGSCRRGLTLDAIAKSLTPTGKLQLKLKEKALLRTALYQRYFMDRIPLHAIVNETVKIAKKCGMAGKSGFFNALLRKTEQFTPSIPQENLSDYYSYPPILIKAFLDAYGEAESRSLLSLFNSASLPMARKIGTNTFTLLHSSEEVKKLAQSSEYYIQNSTPSNLMRALIAEQANSILDLCASPGGKLMIAHELFPKAALFANDVSLDKIETLKQNLAKYAISAETHIGKGEAYPPDRKFDLIIVDAPCSNTGVLHKRPEARWRYAPKQLEQIQLALLKHAASLLSPKGAIWYITCSILPEENEELVHNACNRFNLKLINQKTILPNIEHADGGYGATLHLSHP